MMSKPILSVLILLAVLLGALAPAVADEEFKSDAERLVTIRSSLDKVRANPAAKAEVIAYARKRMTPPDVEQRLSKLGSVLDAAVALTPQQYTTKKEALAMKILAIVHPPEKH